MIGLMLLRDVPFADRLFPLMGAWSIVLKWSDVNNRKTALDLLIEHVNFELIRFERNRIQKMAQPHFD
jgi:hypothetical protein